MSEGYGIIWVCRNTTPNRTASVHCRMSFVSCPSSIGVSFSPLSSSPYAISSWHKLGAGMPQVFLLDQCRSASVSRFGRGLPTFEDICEGPVSPRCLNRLLRQRLRIIWHRISTWADTGCILRTRTRSFLTRSKMVLIRASSGFTKHWSRRQYHSSRTSKTVIA